MVSAALTSAVPPGPGIGLGTELDGRGLTLDGLRARKVEAHRMEGMFFSWLTDLDEA